MGFIKGVFKVAIGIVLAIVIIVVIVGAAASSKSGKEAGREAVRELHEDVAKDFIEQYEMAKRNGSKMDVCVRAGVVAESYLQAKNESEYARWKKIKDTDCRRAGLSE